MVGLALLICDGVFQGNYYIRSCDHLVKAALRCFGHICGVGLKPTRTLKFHISNLVCIRGEND